MSIPALDATAPRPLVPRSNARPAPLERPTLGRDIVIAARARGVGGLPDATPR